MYSKISNDTACWFSVDAELLHAAEGILNDTALHVYKVFGDREAYRQKYRLAFEINASFSDHLHGASVFECLEGFDLSRFTLPAFQAHIHSLENLSGMLLGRNGTQPAEWDDQHIFANYLSAVAFAAHVGDYVDEVFSLAEELRTDAFAETLSRYDVCIQAALENIRSELQILDPLLYSDKLLRKNMYHRGPYRFFTFSPSVFLRYRGVRYTGREQCLFFTVRDAAFDHARMLEQLKALTDNNRFKIIMMLKENRHLQGTDIARSLDLTAATVSHHIRVLREAGLLHEEQDGTARMYSLPTGMAEMLSEQIYKCFG